MKIAPSGPFGGVQVVGEHLKKALFFNWLLYLPLLVNCGGVIDEKQTAKAQAVGVLTSRIASSPKDLGVGDIMWLEFSSSGKATIDLSEAGPSSKFYVLLQSTATNEASQSLTLSQLSLNTALHRMLRENERWLAETETEQIGFETPVTSIAKSVVKAPSVGDEETFRLLSSLSSTSQYLEIQAKVWCTRDQVVVYVDKQVVVGGVEELTTADVENLCDIYNSGLEKEVKLIGDLPDINQDGKVVALLSPEVNRLGSSGGGIVTGYFYAGDLFARGTSAPASNYREIVYLLVPDPKGNYGTAVSKKFTLGNLLTAVFFHEVQHLQNYHQHVFVHKGASEEDWLNEMLAHWMENYIGYNQENYSRYNIYLQNMAKTSIVVSGSPTLRERGGGFLFLQYLYEQLADGSAFIRDLIQTPRTGIENVEKAFASSDSEFNEFSEFLRRFGVVLALTDRGVTQDSRFTFKGRTFNETTKQWQGVCLICEAKDGRGTRLTGPPISVHQGEGSYSVVGSGTRVLEVSQASTPITIQSSAAGKTTGSLIRIK